MYLFFLIFVLIINYAKGMNNPEYVKFCDFWPQIHRLALSNNNTAELLDFLIMNGDEVHRVDFQRNTALHIACASGCEKIAQKLIHFEANINAKNFLGRTPYHQLSLCNNQQNAIKIATLLKNAGADINDSDVFGYTPLHYAARHRKKILCEKLIELSANQLLFTNFGENPHLSDFNSN
jgi:ankyrin repeat protein